jgi:hypothetical protein
MMIAFIAANWMEEKKKEEKKKKERRTPESSPGVR